MNPLAVLMLARLRISGRCFDRWRAREPPFSLQPTILLRRFRWGIGCSCCKKARSWRSGLSVVVRALKNCARFTSGPLGRWTRQRHLVCVPGGPCDVCRAQALRNLASGFVDRNPAPQRVCANVHWLAGTTHRVLLPVACDRPEFPPEWRRRLPVFAGGYRPIYVLRDEYAGLSEHRSGGATDGHDGSPDDDFDAAGELVILSSISAFAGNLVNLTVY